MNNRAIFIGFDRREVDGFAVTRYSLSKRLNTPIYMSPLVLDDLRTRGLYTRDTAMKDGRLWDVISQAPMATEFAISRFLVPYLFSSIWRGGGLAIFMDSDMLVRVDIETLFKEIEQSDERKAVWCVKHEHKPVEGSLKMDGQLQTLYARKNWSSMMVFDTRHPANAALTPELVNTLPGRDLHRFCWLADDEIGALDPKWNFLVGHTSAAVDPAIIHYTEGLPSMPGYDDTEFAFEWFTELNSWTYQRG